MALTLLPTAASAAEKKPTAKVVIPRESSALFKLSFEQSQKLAFGELGWGDAEAKVLSKALTRKTACSKLFLNSNAIGDEGVAALTQSLRAGDAPKLKTINLAGNSRVSEEAARGLVEAREGLVVSFEQPDTKGAVSVKSTSVKKSNLDESALYKLAFEQAETLFFSELG